METSLLIAEDGAISLVYDDDVCAALKELGTISNSRACYVEPNIYEQWVIDVSPIITACSGEPINIGRFPTRREALEVERQWLNHFMETDEILTWNESSKKLE